MNILDQIIEPDTARPKWSEYQNAIFEAGRARRENLLVQAVAGSGKTTTLVELLNHIPGNSLYMAFNKSIAEDIRRKASTGDVKTLNALGHRLWMENRPQARLDSRKVLTILKPLMGEDDFREYGYQLARAVGLAKNCAFGIQGGMAGLGVEANAEAFEGIIDSYDLNVPFERLSEFAAVAYEAFERSRADLETFDFDDQLYTPIREGWAYPQYDNILVDECQDLSPIQHIMLDRFKNARIIAVGDRYQAIYGFRGALADSMDRLLHAFKMIELPLSISYRCGREIIREAQVICPNIEAREDANEGFVLLRDETHHDDPELFNQSMILCRNNAPLFRAILRHVRAKSPCQVMTNFLDSFQGFIRGFREKETARLVIKLDGWRMKELEAARKRGFKGKIAAIKDKYETVRLLCQEFSQTEDVIKLVKRLGEGTSGPTFATIHKAKGLEHNHIYLLRPDLVPSQFAETKEAIQQELNLKYVAITRAKDSFTYGVRPQR